MWRLLFRATHPDAGGREDLFVWVRALHEHVAGDQPEDVRSAGQRREPPRHHDRGSSGAGDRVDYTAAREYESFHHLTRAAIALADSEAVGEPYASLLRLLDDCYEAVPTDVALSRQQQQQGSTYKTLAAVAYAAGMSKQERVQWYRVAEGIPLSQRHGGHILSKLKSAAA